MQFNAIYVYFNKMILTKKAGIMDTQFSFNKLAIYILDINTNWCSKSICKEGYVMKIRYTIITLNKYLEKTNKCLLLDNHGKIKGFTNDLMSTPVKRRKKK